jgi:ComF family protein
MRFVHTFHILLDYLFPPSPDTLLVRGIRDDQVPLLFLLKQVRDVRVLGTYTDSRIRALVHEAKFHQNRRAYVLLGNLLTQYFNTRTTPVDIVLPVPLSSSRMRSRGYNQVEQVLLHAILPHHAVIRTDILKRKIHTRPQTELTRKERLVNVRDAFDVAHENDITGKHIILIDDVLTTGATLHAAKAALLQHSPASVTCVALAH